jgi:fructose-1,6-bisphosphatase/inositol monophosphatase family enzyme
MDRFARRVLDAVRAVGDEVVLPAFETCPEIEWKGDGTPVTEADRAAEAALSARLRAIVDAPVFGEEGIASDPARLWRLATAERAWIVDPIDGTRQFAAGDTRFSILVAWVLRGEAVASWIVHPALGLHAVATNDGCFVDGQPAPRPAGAGPVLANLAHFPPSIPRDRGTEPDLNSGWALRRLLTGEAKAHLTSHVTPWDSAAGVVAWRAAGGTVERTDRRPWRLSDTEAALLYAADPTAWDALHHALLDGYDGAVAPSFRPPGLLA